MKQERIERRERISRCPFSISEEIRFSFVICKRNCIVQNRKRLYTFLCLSHRRKTLQIRRRHSVYSPTLFLVNYTHPTSKYRSPKFISSDFAGFENGKSCRVENPPDRREEFATQNSRSRTIFTGDKYGR